MAWQTPGLGVVQIKIALAHSIDLISISGRQAARFLGNLCAQRDWTGAAGELSNARSVEIGVPGLVEITQDVVGGWFVRKIKEKATYFVMKGQSILEYLP
ncbi:hypothetical protein AC579_4399 [Pseudocercospora musae]|uniref:Uncharacterized protein n=1 Tax=Pseudocercospora musae TaxID=113226 RepID=A0A139IK91_9PEZI|nr:hypothetical protein AC579_4399 [Pseudocercospora musae]